MVLLTSSQVGVTISSIIIFLCTSALFLSGYVLQQKTVNDIRRAIKPQLAPIRGPITPYFSKQYRDKELWDGRKAAELVVVKESSGEQNGEEGVDESMIGATRWQKAKRAREKERLREEKERESLGAEDETLSRAARRKKIKDDIVASGGEGFKGYRRRMW